MSQTRLAVCPAKDEHVFIYDLDSGDEVRIHTDLWFPDGSIVLRAENTLFRVHMSQLSRHSVCFHDMFSLASASASTVVSSPEYLRIIGNCPVLFLQDKADDLAHLLTALYDGP